MFINSYYRVNMLQVREFKTSKRTNQTNSGMSFNKNKGAKGENADK